MGSQGVADLSVEEAKDLRRRLAEEEKRLKEAEARLETLEKELAVARKDSVEVARLKAEVEILKRENEELKARKPEVIEKIVEKTVKDPEQEKRIKELEQKVAALRSQPPKVIEKVPDDYKDIKRQLQMKNEELLALTRSQILQKDRYKVRDILSSLIQTVGKYMKQAELEIRRLPDDVEVYKDVMECADILVKAAEELKNWVSCKTEIVEGEVVNDDIAS